MKLSLPAGTTYSKLCRQFQMCKQCITQPKATHFESLVNVCKLLLLLKKIRLWDTSKFVGGQNIVQVASTLPTTLRVHQIHKQTQKKTSTYRSEHSGMSFTRLFWDGIQRMMMMVIRKDKFGHINRMPTDESWPSKELLEWAACTEPSDSWAWRIWSHWSRGWTASCRRIQCSEDYPSTNSCSPSCKPYSLSRHSEPPLQIYHLHSMLL